MYGGKCVMIKIYAVVIKMTSSWINILCEWCRNRLNYCYIQINAYGFPKSSPTSSLQGAAFILTGISTSRDCVDPRQWLPLPSLRLFAGPEVSLWKYLCQPHLFKHWWLDIGFSSAVSISYSISRSIFLTWVAHSICKMGLQWTCSRTVFQWKTT